MNSPIFQASGDLNADRTTIANTIIVIYEHHPHYKHSIQADSRVIGTIIEKMTPLTKTLTVPHTAERGPLAGILVTWTLKRIDGFYNPKDKAQKDTSLVTFYITPDLKDAGLDEANRVIMREHAEPFFNDAKLMVVDFRRAKDKDTKYEIPAFYAECKSSVEGDKLDICSLFHLKKATGPSGNPMNISFQDYKLARSLPICLKCYTNGPCYCREVSYAQRHSQADQSRKERKKRKSLDSMAEFSFD